MVEQIAGFVTRYPWVWPTSEILHFIGLALLFGVVLLVNLRVVGIAKNVSFTAFHGLLPLAVVGFAISLVSGMLFFIAAPEQYTQNASFHWKIGLMLLAGANLLFLTLFDEAERLVAGADAPATARVIAGTSVFAWIGVMYFGRMLPFLGTAF